MSGILTSWYSRVWGFIGFKICLISFCFKCWITEYFIFLFSLKTCSMSKHIIVSPLMFPVIEMLWFFCCCQELHHLACCLWPVKDKPVEALCLREKKRHCSKTTQEVPQFQLCTLTASSVVTVDCLFLLHQHSQTAQERLPLTERRGGGEGWRWRWAENCSFWRRTTSKRGFFCPWRPLLSNRKPRCQI